MWCALRNEQQLARANVKLNSPSPRHSLSAINISGQLLHAGEAIDLVCLVERRGEQVCVVWMKADPPLVPLSDKHPEVGAHLVDVKRGTSASRPNEQRWRIDSDGEVLPGAMREAVSKVPGHAKQLVDPWEAASDRDICEVHLLARRQRREERFGRNDSSASDRQAKVVRQCRLQHVDAQPRLAAWELVAEPRDDQRSAAAGDNVLTERSHAQLGEVDAPDAVGGVRLCVKDLRWQSCRLTARVHRKT
eukprot:CAMPEP_0113253172 /NCGR_PEP_ID=MMETSP0008_2-20120614/13026_1 /TAXON_ID=97485 /ORGANISM="Prymnesium parvum" /LENGTH=247 /DNA_ID=CAMNT_0000101305 /DNA_START=428 /DNA_END=1171 /DNA_ORIENTATION=+ /assembly_acc=CAM_ASM_000153